MLPWRESVLEGMLKGSSALRIKHITDEVVRNKLREVAMLFSSVSDHVEAILELSPDLFDIKIGRDAQMNS